MTSTTEQDGGGPKPDAASRTRWLDDQQQSAWRATASIMIKLPAALDARMQREAGLTFFEYMALALLSEAEDRTMGMSALAAATSSSLSRLSHVAGRLEGRGLLARSRVPGPGRRTNATLTDRGYAAVVSAAPRHVTAVREYFVDVLQPGDVEALYRIGTAVGARIDGDARAWAGTPEPEAD